MALFGAGANAAAQAAPERQRAGGYYAGHGIAIGVLGAGGLLTQALLVPTSGVDAAWFPGDLSVRSNHASSAARVSDAGLVLAVAAPALENTALGVDWRLLNAGVVYAETLTANALLNAVTKAWVQRRRPYTYWTDAEHAPFGQNRGDWYVSFYSGHASTSFAAAFSGSYLFGEAAASRTARMLVWGSEFGLASATAILRVRAGKHYYSDVLVGALIGSGIGIAVPLAHGGRYAPSAADCGAAAAGIVFGGALSALLPITNDVWLSLSPLAIPRAAGAEVRGAF